MKFSQFFSDIAANPVDGVKLALFILVICLALCIATGLTSRRKREEAAALLAREQAGTITTDEMASLQLLRRLRLGVPLITLFAIISLPFTYRNLLTNIDEWYAAVGDVWPFLVTVIVVLVGLRMLYALVKLRVEGVRRKRARSGDNPDS